MIELLSTPAQYEEAMRDVIRRVQRGEISHAPNGSIEEMEVIADCIRLGYINGRLNLNGETEPFRTLDGKIHPEILNNHIPLKGLCFLQPDKTAQKAGAAMWLSLIALVVSILSNLDKILINLQMLIDLLPNSK